MGEALSLMAAKDRIDAAVRPIEGTERIALKDAVGRVLAEDVVSGVAVPPYDNAAMDGYALCGDTGDRGWPRTLRVVGEARAGQPFAAAVGPGECVRILTGAAMPADCDAVVPQEEVVVVDDRVTIDRPTPLGQHRRLAGEDLDIGDVVIAKGRRATPSDLGLAASIGRSTLNVMRRARVAVFSTGNELRDVDQPLDPGCVHDSNRYSLIGLLDGLGTDVIDLGIVTDEPRALEAAIRHACSDAVAADAVVTSGGVSTGDADHTRAVLATVGRVSFWKLAVKPGRPMAFGEVAHGDRRALLFGLPGNPVAVMVVFHALVRDALSKLMGARVEPMPAITAVCDAPLAKAVGRTEFVRCVARRDGGAWHVRPTGSQGSGILRSMSEANCLVVLDHDRGPVAIGDRVEAWPFHGLL